MTSITDIAAPGAGAGRTGARARRWLRRRAAPVLAVVLGIVALWYAACVPMNVKETLTFAERAGAEVTPASPSERRAMGRWALVAANPGHLGGSFALDRPRLPAPHQVVAELWKTTVETAPTSKRSLVWHGWVTLSATLLGFGIGTALGVLLAVGIVHDRAMDMSVLPWAIASQTIPILAIAPMIIVVLNSIGLQGLIPKALISAYLSFFPVVVSMVAGLRSPAASQMDLMHTYSATPAQVFWTLRLPASVPYLFAALKVGIAAALIGAIVGELPTGASEGLGARLLAGSYYGQTVQIWSALFAAAILAAAMVGTIGALERATLRRMGFAR
nr:ABC transporter permease [Rhodosalinus sediminis]